MNRRDFLKASGATGLTWLFHLSLLGSAAHAAELPVLVSESADALAPNAFIRVMPDHRVILLLKHLEMGQGISTGLATIVAEELDANWEQIHVQFAPANAKLYNNHSWGPVQGTGQSSSLANSFEQIAQAAATVRHLLLAAAAQHWQTTLDQLKISDGVIWHQDGLRQARFGDLVTVASSLPVPELIQRKHPQDYRIIGTTPPAKGGVDKINGKTSFTIDVQQDGMKTALVAHAPRFGATVLKIDASAAMSVPGVLEVVQIPTGVAVIAESFWPALQARKLLRIDWDERDAFALSSSEIMAMFKTLAAAPGTPVKQSGDVIEADRHAAKRCQAEFEYPYLAHAAMEPMNAVMKMSDQGCQLWNAEQFQTLTQLRLSTMLGMPLDQVHIHVQPAGGSFGRRSNPVADYQAELASLMKATAGRYTIKLQWTREDDFLAGYFRPMNYHTLQATLDARGRISSWQHRIVGQSILAGTPLAPVLIRDGVDPMSVEGAVELAYQIPNVHVDLHSPKLKVPVLWWRSVAHSHTAFSVETFMDELSELAGQDPLAFRQCHLVDDTRMAAVLQCAAESAGWGQAMPLGHGRGIAIHKSFNTYVAQVAEVQISDAGELRVTRVVCAVDCGQVVNPGIVEAQMQGGIGFGLSAALKEQVEFENGTIKQDNYDRYPLLTINEMPRVEVHILPSNAAPTGVGECGVPPIAPAVCNAIYMASGTRIRRLPILQNTLKPRVSLKA